jgi:hypothetical protein
VRSLKAEIAALTVLASLYLLLGSPAAAVPVAGVGAQELYLAFSLVFTFVVGMEVVR